MVDEISALLPFSTEDIAHADDGVWHPTDEE